MANKLPETLIHTEYTLIMVKSTKNYTVMKKNLIIGSIHVYPRFVVSITGTTKKETLYDVDISVINSSEELPLE